MVLEALRFATRGDSATSRSTLRNGSITSFFSPLSTSQPVKAEPQTLSDSKLNTIERLGRSTEAVDRAPVPPRPPTPPAAATAASSDTRKRKTTPRPANVAQNRSARNGAPARHQNSPSQAPAAVADTKLIPATVKTSQETRTLRSKEKALFKSDLALYFGNYEEILLGVQREPEFLRVDEPIYIIDEASKGSPHTSPAKGKTVTIPARTRAPSVPQTVPSAQAAVSITRPPPVQDQSPVDAKTIHLQSPAKDQSTSDPLGDETYMVYHKRAERREKQVRNIENERAQHKKAHLERLLDGLQGPDWLRVLGVSGVTEHEQKEWKPKRNYFIKEVSELVGKFRRWKDAERRLRLKKEREREAELEDDTEAESGASARASSSDLDARAAYQLLQEAGQTPKPPRRRKAQHVLYEAPPSPEQPFTGFYKDPHLRAQALGEVRHGRNITAFGVALPDPPEEDFELWPDLTTHDSRRARDRKRRKLKDEPDKKREFL